MILSMTMKHDYQKYYDLEEVIGYNGFILPDGSFLKVRKMEDYHTNHYLYARDYLRDLNLFPDVIINEYNAMNYIVEKLNYVAYMLSRFGTSYMETDFPLTKSQKDAIQTLNQLNQYEKKKTLSLKRG